MANISTVSEPAEEVLFIRPSRGWSALNLRDLWRYRELIYFLTWRDIAVRYKQTALGVAWAVIQPFFTMVVFTIFFGGLAKVPTDNVPGPIFFYTGLLPWGMFTKAISDAGRSLVTNRSMITKVYFPRLVIPISSVLSGVVDLAIAFVVLLGIIAYYNYAPLPVAAAPAAMIAATPTADCGCSAGGTAREATLPTSLAAPVPEQPQVGLAQVTSRYHVTLTARVWLLPLFLLLAIVTALGMGLWLSALNVAYRDIGYILPFLTQFWMFITPIAYPSSLIPEKWKLVYALNPMTGVVEGFRWSLLGSGTPPGPMLAVSSAIALLLLVTGLFYFRRMERTFADMV